jgi:DNA segregation ATPase FtsK/SpoIIIE-like protein
LLIVSKNKAYIIDGYFCVNEVTDFGVADVREDIARGCVEFNKDMPTRQRICEALHSVEAMRGKKHFPAIVLDTATGKKETWWSYEDALAKTQDEWTDEMHELYKKALQVVISEQQASMTLLQRKLSIGYNKAGMLIERMEEENYIEEFKGGASRKVLITQAQFDERFHG